MEEQLIKEIDQLLDELRKKYYGGIYRRSALDVLIEQGNYSPEWMLEEYGRIEQKQSKQPRRVRAFVEYVVVRALIRLGS